MIKRIINVFFAISLVFSLFLFSGCEKETQIPETQPTPETVSNEVEDVSFGMCELYDPQSEAAKFITEYIEQHFKIKIKPITMSADNYQSEMDWMIGANMLPDVFEHDITGNKFQVKILISSGLIQPIPKEIWALEERLSAVMSWYENIYSYDGNMYFIPRTFQTFDQTHGATDVIFYRSDWATALSQNTYKDTADFIDITKLLGAYRGSDTDQNTIWDTWGITGSGGIDFIWDMFLTPFGVREWVYENGQWIPGVISEGAKEAISWAAQLYREGIIDPEIAAQTPEKALGKFLAGKAGALMSSAYYEDLVYLEQEWETHNPDKPIMSSVKIIPSYTTPEGEVHNGVSTFMGGSMISSNVSGSKMQKILDLYDFLFSAEGRKLLEYGDVESSEQTETGQDFLGSCLDFKAFENIASWNLDKSPLSEAADSEFVTYATDMIKTNVWPWSFDGELFTNGMLTPEMCVLDINLIAEEKILALIKTTRDFDADWESYVKSMYSELNLEAAIAEVNERAEEFFGADDD